MLRMIHKLFIKAFLLSTALFILLPARSQNDFEVAKNVDIFVTILKELNAKYADEISPGTLTKTAIDAMLESLDPYTVYYPESQIEEFKLMTTGQYGGIGALIQQYGNYVVISEPYENSPAAKAGLLAGDRILKINNQSTVGKNSDDISTILKGEPGTNISLEIERPGADKPLTFNITRKEIKMPNIPYSGILEHHIGYIKLDQFTDNAGNEVKEAFLKLKEQGMDYLILDLRNNGGGLLNEAVNIMNIFVDQNIMIAETKGKIKEQSNVYKTRYPVVDRQIPVVVLVNNLSASASEIVSGAFQDLDRGVIVGKKTYGKGLVQNIVPLSYNTTLKITVSKYYIPSGRCVQNIDYFNKDTLNNSPYIPDSLATPFKTLNGRTVYDKGGIEPDVMTPDTIASNILIALVMHNLIFDYANQFYATHPTILPAEKFVITDAIYNDFISFLKGKDYSYTTDSEELLEELKKAAIEEKYFPAIESLYKEMSDKITQEKAIDLIKFKDEISQYLGSEIAVRYYFQKGRIINSLTSDPDVKYAKDILLDQPRYKAILSGKKPN
jgi:carboxyl-terminal processing protease